jgi:3D (Asp-Asp-Asp) domain-containing protein
MIAVTVIVISNLLVHPFALAAELDTYGQCLNSGTVEKILTSCDESICSISTVVAKKAVKKAEYKAAVLSKSQWSPVSSDMELEANEMNHGLHSMTAYTSEVAQTDSSPCTTANGFNVCKHGIEDTVAANFLPFGSKVKIPDLFGDRVFIVRDRMNSRYSERVDVWMKSKPDALQFGVRTARIVVLK